MGIETAIKCFQENCVDFADAGTQPEKYNLYTGLANLAETVGELQILVRQVRNEVQQLRQDVHQLSHDLGRKKG